MTLFFRLLCLTLTLGAGATAAWAADLPPINPTFMVLQEHPTQPTVVRVLIDSGVVPPGSPSPPAPLHLLGEPGETITITSVALDSPYFELVVVPELPAEASQAFPVEFVVRATGQGNGWVQDEMHIGFGTNGLLIADLVAWVDIVDSQDFSQRSATLNFESGNLTGWTTTYGVPPVVTPAAALSGAYGMLVSWDGVTSQSFVQKNHPTAQPLSRAIFQIDLGHLQLSQGVTQALAAHVASGGVPLGWVQLRRASAAAAAFEVRAMARLDSGGQVATPWLLLPESAAELTFDWWAATSSTANNGGVRVRAAIKDAVYTTEVRTLDNDSYTTTVFRLGALWGVTDSTEGTVAFDRVVLNY